jgi:type VI protein secretion system component Hcp
MFPSGMVRETDMTKVNKVQKDLKQELANTESELREEQLEQISGGGSAPNVSDIVVTKRMDKASPKLFIE